MRLIWELRFFFHEAHLDVVERPDAEVADGAVEVGGLRKVVDLFQTKIFI